MNTVVMCLLVWFHFLLLRRLILALIAWGLLPQVTTGASDDLRRVTAMVYQMIGVYGMGDGIGQLAFPQDNGGGGFPQER